MYIKHSVLVEFKCAVNLSYSIIYTGPNVFIILIKILYTVFVSQCQFIFNITVYIYINENFTAVNTGKPMEGVNKLRF